MGSITPYYTILDHTADLGIRVWGTDLIDLFKNAGKALMDLIIRSIPAEKGTSERISVSGHDLADLMVKWLGEILYLFEGENLLQKNRGEMSRIRGEKIAMILQDPMMSLNPVFTIGNQIGETLRYHQGLHSQILAARIQELLLDVRIPEPERRMKQYKKRP